MVAEEMETQLSSTMPGWWRSLDVFNNKHPFQSWRDDGRGLLWRGAALHRLHSPLGQSIDDVCRILRTWSPYPYTALRRSRSRFSSFGNAQNVGNILNNHQELK